MSDTCWLQIRFRRKDLEKFNKILEEKIGKEWWDQEDSADPEQIHATVYKANWGWTNLIEELVQEKLTFQGEHAAGGSYGPMVFACFEGDFEELNSDWDGDPTISVPEDGRIEKQMEKVNHYYDLMRKTKKIDLSFYL